MLCLLNGLLCLTAGGQWSGPCLPRFSCWPAAFSGKWSRLCTCSDPWATSGMSWRCGWGRGSAVPLAGVGPAGAWKLNMSKRPRRE
ncbi:MAG: hypothetical protein ACLTYN_06770 [Dysosmobacter welbionis]